MGPSSIFGYRTLKDTTYDDSCQQYLTRFGVNSKKWLNRAIFHLRFQSVQESREWDCLPDMRQLADPGDGAFEADAEAGVRDGAVAADVQVPLEGFLRQAVVLDALFQEREVVDALTAADDLAVAFGGEHVVVQDARRVLGVGLHVEGLDLDRVVVDEDRLVVLLGEERLVVGAEIVPFLDVAAEFAALGDRFGVGDAREAAFGDLLERRDVALQG